MKIPFDKKRLSVYGRRFTVFQINYAMDIGGWLGSVGADSSALFKTRQMRLKPHLQGAPSKKGDHIRNYINLLFFKP